MYQRDVDRPLLPTITARRFYSIFHFLWNIVLLLSKIETTTLHGGYFTDMDNWTKKRVAVIVGNESCTCPYTCIVISSHATLYNLLDTISDPLYEFIRYFPWKSRGCFSHDLDWTSTKKNYNSCREIYIGEILFHSLARSLILGVLKIFTDSRQQ